MELRVAAYAVVVDDEGRLLLAHLAAPGRDEWTLPGGGINPGEDPQDAAMREVLEETGLRVEIDELLGVDSLVLLAPERPPGYGDAHGIRIVYRAHVVGGELRDEIGGSTDRAAWHNPAELKSLPVTGLVRKAQEFADRR